MATLTPLAKILGSAIIVTAAASAVWNLGLKDRLTSSGDATAPRSTAAAPAATTEAPGSTSAAAAAAAVTAPRPSGTARAALGTSANPLKVSIVSFHGYAPALVANGKSLKTLAGSIYDRLGIAVEFVIQDDIPTLATIFESRSAQCAWRTSDFWAQEQPNLRNAGHDARAIMIVDNTQGGDAIITRDPAIRSVEDLAGRSVAMLQYTPSHGMTIDAIENSSLSARKRDTVRYVFINAAEGTAGVRAAFEAGNVDAAALWDPDLALALRAVPGARVVYSTKVASNLIFDIIVCDARELARPENAATFERFVQGWMLGVQAARANPDEAVDALVRNEELFTLLAKKEGRPFIKSLFDNVVWTGLEDNARILGLVGGTNHYERVYGRFDQIYRAAGALANPKSPVIPAQDSFDYRFIKVLLQKDRGAEAAAAKPAVTFTESAAAQAVARPAVVTKPVTVSFAVGSADLSKRAQKTIDTEMVPFIENNGTAYFEVSGNTDSTGTPDVNLRLSQARAAAVVEYLARQWEFPKARFRIIGNGSAKPLCNEAAPERDGLTLEECRAANRTTRLAVFSR